MDWQKAYENGNTPWEKGREHPEMERLFQLGWFDDWKDIRVLCPGAGLGHDVRFLRKCNVSALGIDISSLAVKKSLEFDGDAPSSVVEGDVFAAEDWKSFSGVWEHTCYCAIEPKLREKYVQSMAQIVPANGLLQGVFFLNPDHDEAGPPYGVKKEELFQFFEPFFEIIDSFIPLNTYEGREDRELALRLKRRE